MELIIFDASLNYLGVLDGFHSYRKVRRYDKVGEFELHVAFSLEKMKMLELGNIIWQKGQDQAGYIRFRNIQLSKEGDEVIVISGSLMSGYLDKRIIWGRENLSGSAESIIRTLLERHAVNPSNPSRKIPLLELSASKGFKGNMRKQATYKSLLETVQELAVSSGLGFRTKVDVNEKKLIFDIYEGVNRSRRAVFSREFDNVIEQEYVEASDNHRNVALIAGVGEGSERKVASIDGNESGLQRLELFVDANDIEDTKTINEEEVAISESEYTELLKNRGFSKLAENIRIESFDGKVHPQSNLVYQRDYDLGDIVTIKDGRWGLMIDERIVEVEEVYEEDGLNIFIVFGEDEINLIEKIKQVVN